MKTLEEIEAALAEARQESKEVTGTPAEVYSRIVGYYRSVRNWNKGKREEYVRRELFDVGAPARNEKASACPAPEDGAPAAGAVSADEARLVLFVRPRCPACPDAKAAAGALGIPVDTVDADTESGLEAAQKMNVFSTPTAILLARDGRELRRARDAGSIAALLDAVA